MKTIIPSFIKASIISSLLLIALGILLIVRSEATIMTISYVIGAILIAIGVLAEIEFLKESKNDLTKTDMAVIYGIVCIILGIVVINNPEAIASIIPLVIGVIIIVNSAVKLQYSFELKKEKNDLWLSTLILSIVMLVCGVVLIFNPFAGAVLLTKIVGVFILVYAILDLVSTFFIRNTLKKFQEAVKDVTEAKVIEEESNKELKDPEEK
jgi:uncharacterized membrane protein HdeD (DUF308 family)